MGLLGKIFGGNNRNKRISNWAKTIPISESQSVVMKELWKAGKEKCPPELDPLEKL